MLPDPGRYKTVGLNFYFSLKKVVFPQFVQVKDPNRKRLVISVWMHVCWKDLLFSYLTRHIFTDFLDGRREGSSGRGAQRLVRRKG
jgi:hypothetical protein